MSDTVIKVECLSKSYFIGHQSQERYTALRDVIANQARNIGRRLLHPFKSSEGGLITADQTEEFWALKDVSFEIKRGDRVGIIGRNGAGKSTLLKILSRITEPTEGRIEIEGRVASLLEVGTGFHPELTGRENIFLNGAILGMTRAEIKRKFDEIVAFAEIEKFLDTPVKRYSSGMYVRLAFAVAAHLEPEILVIDEVLAVGDAQFQKKCLGRMGDVAEEGKTILFVSHNMNAVERLCNQLFWIEGGKLAGKYDDVRTGIMAYIKMGSEQGNSSIWKNNGSAYQNDYFIPERFEIISRGPGVSSFDNISNQYPILVSIQGVIKQVDPALNIGIGVYREDGSLIFMSFTTDNAEEEWPHFSVGFVKLKVELPNRWLNEGNYRIELLASLHYRQWLLEPDKNAPNINFTIQGGLSDSPYWDHKRPGILAPVFHWSLG